MDSYLHILCQSKNALHISCVIMTSIFAERSDINTLLRKVCFIFSIVYIKTILHKMSSKQQMYKL